MNIIESLKELVAPSQVQAPPVQTRTALIATAPKTVVNKDPFEAVLNKGYVPHPVDLNKYTQAYNIPLVQAALNKQVDFALSVEPIIRGDERSRVAASEFMRRLNFSDVMRRTLLNKFIYGFCAWEKLGALEYKNGVQVTNKKNVIRLKLIDPTTFFVKTDQSGRIIGFCQKPSSQSEIELEKQDVSYFTSTRVDSSPYGRSMLFSLITRTRIPGKNYYNPLTNKLLAEAATSELIDKYANPHIHVQYGTPGEVLNANQLQDAQSKLEAIRDKTHWVTGANTKMEVLQVEGKALDLTAPLTYMDQQIVAALQTPWVLLGAGNVAEGLADRQMAAFYLKIKADLQTFEDTFESDILNPYLKSLGLAPVEIDWEEFPEIEQQKLTALTGLLNISTLSSKTKADVENQIRQMLRIQGQVTTFDIDSAKPSTPQFGQPTFTPPIASQPKENAQEKFDVLESLHFPHAVTKDVSEAFNIRQSAIDFIRGYAFDEITSNTDAIPALRSILAAGIETGESVRGMTNKLTKVLGEDKAYDAERLIRTELARAENQGAINSFLKADVKEVEWLTAEDERTDDECMAHNGERYSLVQAEGMLPVHPGCRCTWVPITK